MRWLQLLVLLLFCSTLVTAIGLRVPEDAKDQVRLHVGEVEEFSVELVGDAVSKNVLFFVQSPDPSVLVSLKGDEFYSVDEHEVELGVYNVTKEHFFVKGMKGHEEDVAVVYGVRYGNGSEKGSVGYEQVMQSQLQVMVRERSTVQNISFSSGGGSGGGGAALPQQRQPNASSASVQDVAGDNREVAEMVADDVGQKEQVSLRTTDSTKKKYVQPGVTVTKSGVAGKGLLMTIIVLLVIFMGLLGLSVKAVKMDGDEA